MQVLTAIDPETAVRGSTFIRPGRAPLSAICSVRTEPSALRWPEEQTEMDWPALGPHQVAPPGAGSVVWFRLRPLTHSHKRRQTRMLTMLNTFLHAIMICLFLAVEAPAQDDVSFRSLQALRFLRHNGDYTDGLKLSEQILSDPNLRPDLKAGCLLEMGCCLAGKRRYAEAITAFREVPAAAPDADRAMLMEAQRRIWLAFQAIPSKDHPTYQEALESGRKFLTEYPDASLAQRLNIRIGMASYHYVLGRVDKALSEYERVVAEKDAESYYKSRALIQMANIYSGRREFERAISTLARIRNEYPDTRADILAHGDFRTALVYASLQKPNDALDAYIRGLSTDAFRFSPKMRSPFLWALAAPQSTAKVDAACQALRSAILQTCHNEQVSDNLHILFIEALLQQQRLDEALFEAKVLTETCNADIVEHACELLSKAVGASDGDISRVGRFLEYQTFLKAGPDGQLGSNDDLADPFADIKHPPNEERERLFSQRLESLPSDWTGRLTRARVYRKWGKPLAALRELHVAFELCPLQRNALEQVVDRIVDVLAQVSGDPSIGQQFINYLSAGPEEGHKSDQNHTNPLIRYLEM